MLIARTNPGKPSIEDVKRTVAESFQLHVAQLEGRRRRRDVARPRQIAMYLARHFAQGSVSEIGRRFNKNHATVLHALRRVPELCRSDAEFAHDVAFLEAGFAGREETGLATAAE